MPQSALETFAVRVLNETCSTVANCASRTAVQLAYGQANLVKGLVFRRVFSLNRFELDSCEAQHGPLGSVANGDHGCRVSYSY